MDRRREMTVLALLFIGLLSGCATLDAARSQSALGVQEPADWPRVDCNAFWSEHGRLPEAEAQKLWMAATTNGLECAFWEAGTAPK